MKLVKKVSFIIYQRFEGRLVAGPRVGLRRDEVLAVLGRVVVLEVGGGAPARGQGGQPRARGPVAQLRVLVVHVLAAPARQVELGEGSISQVDDGHALWRLFLDEAPDLLRPPVWVETLHL